MFWPSVTVAAIAVGLLLIVTHAAGRRLIRTRAAEAPNQRQWKLRWTVSILAGVFLLFGAGIALVGLTHQVIWLAGSDEPLRAAAFKHWRAPRSEWHLREHGQALFNWSAQHGSLPPGGSFDEQGRALHSWETHILPYLNYYSQIDLDLPWTHPENQPHFRSVLPQFLNPEFRTAPFVDNEGRGLSHYAANVHVLGPGTKTDLAQIGDDAANTILLGEVNSRFAPWGHPINWRDPALGVNRSPDGFGGPRAAGGAQFLMADGSVRFLSENVDRRTLRSLSGAPTVATP